MAVQISGNDITVPRDGTFSRNVSIAGPLTYEDVTNVDSIGLVTARNGIEVGASPGVAASISVDGNMIVSGISTFGGNVNIPDKILHSGDDNTSIRFAAADTFTVETGGSEIVRVDSDGHFGIGMSPSGVRLDVYSTVNDIARFSGANSGGITIRNDTANEVQIHTGSSDALIFGTDGENERLRIGTSGQLGIAGANYGTSGQVLQSQGSGSAVQWATPSLWTHGTRTDISGSDGYTFTGVPDGASHIRYNLSYCSPSEQQQFNLRLEKSTTGGSKSIITSGYQSYSTYTYQGAYGGGGKTTSVELWKGMTNATNKMFGTLDIYRLGSNGTEYLINHVGFVNYNDGTMYTTTQANGYVDLGSSSTDFISGARFYLNGGTIDGGYASQSYQTP